MTLEQLLAAARQAIADGDLAKAEQLKNQAAMLRDVDALAPQPAAAPVTDSAEFKALKVELDDLKAFKDRVESEPATKSAGTLTFIKDEADKKAGQPWEDLGSFLKAVQMAAMYPGRMDDRLKAQKAVMGSNEGIPSEGGYLVQPNFANEIFMLEHATGEILPRVRRLPVGPNNNGLTMNAVDETSRANGSRWGGVQAYWAAEGDSVTATKPKFRQMQMKLQKLMAVMYATDEILSDTTQLAAIAKIAVNEELTVRAEEAIFRGTGAGQPAGILNSNALVTVAKESGQAAATVVNANIFKMWSRMWARSRRNAVWFINQDIEPQLFGMTLTVGTGGVPVYLPPGGLSQSPYSTLMGRPVVPIEDASTLGTVGDITLADLTQYICIDKSGVKEAESMHVQFLTDQMTFRWTFRLDGQPAWSSALTPKNGSATQSPFITLATRA
jgi:HK97 family phage major capsid protein